MNKNKSSELYRVTKIFDYELNKPVYETRMCGQAAWANVLSKEAQEVIYCGDNAKIDAYNKAHMDTGDTWIQQSELDPVIGFPVKFWSVKLGAGWWQSAPVVAIAKYEGVPNFKPRRMILQTETGLYLVEVDD